MARKVWIADTRDEQGRRVRTQHATRKEAEEAERTAATHNLKAQLRELRKPAKKAS